MSAGLQYGMEKQALIPVRVRTRRQKQTFLLPCPLCRLSQEGVTYVWGGSSDFLWSGFKVSLPTSKDTELRWVS